MNDKKLVDILNPMEAKPSISELISKYRPSTSYYEGLYKRLHTNPELSRQEGSTAYAITSYLRSLGYLEIRTNIGGHGVVGILRNGVGKTVLLRAELDALPLEEQTGLEFASQTRMVDLIDGVEKPVMHACGHDMHISSLLAASELLYACRTHWTGTLLILFQPDEEHGAGAQAMVSDGLYDPDRHAIPKPDIVLGGHVVPDRAGRLSTRKGIFGSAANSYCVELYGRGAHGSRPHMSIDPIVMASSAVLKLQTIVSRTTNPQEPVVLTVGALHSGDAPNVIPATATLLLNTRTFSPTSRDHVLASITRILNAEALAFNAPKPPLIEDIGSFPLLTNHDSVTQTVIDAFAAHFGAANVNPNAPISMGSEDFANLSDPVGAQGCFWNYGGVEPAVWDEAERNGKLEEIPGNHSPFFAPVIQPTLTVAIDAQLDMQTPTVMEEKRECAAVRVFVFDDVGEFGKGGLGDQFEAGVAGGVGLVVAREAEVGKAYRKGVEHGVAGRVAALGELLEECGVFTEDMLGGDGASFGYFVV
ncbi:MAG: hypothetical protein M1840_001770 [Geoglossum simile]|nr:MAG: hypothetical protein M1840_001770 [Geoglossum simile]